LPTDLVVLRNIDHLSGAPAPSVVFQYQCAPVVEINSGLMVVEPSEAEHERMQRWVRRYAYSCITGTYTHTHLALLIGRYRACPGQWAL
jgi:hypothetical protein